MSEIDVLLQSAGARLEKYQCFYYLKMCRYVDSNSLSYLNWKEISGYSCDTFYQSDNDTDRCGNIFHRKREIYDGNEQLLRTQFVKQIDCHDIPNLSHCYQEQQISSIPREMSTFVQYRFKRWIKIDNRNNTAAVDICRDDICEPLEYSIVTLRTKLDFDPSSEGALESLKGIVSLFQNYSALPAYTKFMLILQCSPSCDLYEDLYSQYDPASALVPPAVLKILHDTASLMNNRDYLWFLDNQIRHAQVMYAMGCDQTTCFSQLKLLKPRGNELIVPCDMVV